MTQADVIRETPDGLPQRSPLISSGMTGLDAGRCGEDGLSATGPAHFRRDDTPNAAPARFERDAPGLRAPRPEGLEAATEPAHFERDDQRGRAAEPGEAGAATEPAHFERDDRLWTRQDGPAPWVPQLGVRLVAEKCV